MRSQCLQMHAMRIGEDDVMFMVNAMAADERTMHKTRGGFLTEERAVLASFVFLPAFFLLFVVSSTLLFSSIAEVSLRRNLQSLRRVLP